MRINKIVIIIVLLITITIGLNTSRKFNDNMHKLPKGEYMNESTSPNGNYTVKILAV